ncbi:unnamed protein product [Pleuronectes platessa]|uniref:Uncharacterized protein n=1 Tax=Pleuronectes platessa TaxID=8262 RepID=A0A9N7TUY2_PLEPL|nr:unnamed protein product [Pleuronectes platessa]
MNSSKPLLHSGLNPLLRACTAGFVAGVRGDDPKEVLVGGGWELGEDSPIVWAVTAGRPRAPRRPQRPQRPGHSNESAGPQAVRTPALVNERWEPGDPGSNWLGHLEQSAETLTHGCHPRETLRETWT